ncbi:MAG TPA: type IV secretory system conjugative DNA transfer family protein, partial [Acidimicrobiales bacterium]|nr:type IV secretory system conjugative DNA transfer family protein [Acidimicrobiales bacterium]
MQRISSAAPGRIQPVTRRGLYVGNGAHGWAWSGAECSVLVLGPPRSGKTSSLVIPNILLSDGPVVSTSTKPEIMRATASARGEGGWNLLYDPSGEVECPPGVERVGWSPLHTAAHWDTAVVTADAMVGASRLHGLRASEHHWTERASALLSTLLHAAALEELAMADVLHWIDRHDGSRALEILDEHPGAGLPATDLLAGIVATDPRE